MITIMMMIIVVVIMKIIILIMIIIVKLITVPIVIAITTGHTANNTMQSFRKSSRTFPHFISLKRRPVAQDSRS